MASLSELRAAEEEAKIKLQKSYSFDNVSFAAVDLHEVDMKHIGAIQKAMTAMKAEMPKEMAGFTADDMAKTVKAAGPRSIIQSGALDGLKALVADPKTKENAYTLISALSAECKTMVEPFLVPMIQTICEDVAHKKKEVQIVAEEVTARARPCLTALPSTTRTCPAPSTTVSDTCSRLPRRLTPSVTGRQLTVGGLADSSLTLSPLSAGGAQPDRQRVLVVGAPGARPALQSAQVDQVAGQGACVQPSQEAGREAPHAFLALPPDRDRAHV